MADAGRNRFRISGRRGPDDRHRHSGIDILAVNVGMSYECPAIDHDDETWRRAMSVNLDGSFHSARAFARPILERGRGAIVLTSSIAGVKVVQPEQHVGYDVAKAGVAHMARVLGSNGDGRASA